jgi:hypothetical protein
MGKTGKMNEEKLQNEWEKTGKMNRKKTGKMTILQFSRRALCSACGHSQLLWRRLGVLHIRGDTEVDQGRIGNQ